ncbi:MAG: response regulator [Myxococcales bacterium FL481]|nr:MAG: response regulator [Myxococcales bacterium FL481]
MESRDRTVQSGLSLLVRNLVQLSGGTGGRVLFREETLVSIGDAPSPAAPDIWRLDGPAGFEVQIWGLDSRPSSSVVELGLELVDCTLSPHSLAAAWPAFQSFPLGMVIARGESLALNAAAERLLGYRNAELSDLDRWFEALYGERADGIRRLYETNRRNGFKTKPAVVPVRCKDGTTRHIEFRGGEADGAVYWILSDVTELQLSEQRFRLLWEQSSDAHLLFDEHGIIDCNRAAIDMLRLQSREQVLGLHPAVLSPERQPDGQRSSDKAVDMDRLAAERGFHRFDWMHRRATGEVFPVEVSLTPVTLAAGKALLVVWHEVSERVEREQALRAAKEDAEAGLRARSQFLATMSHELRTPLNGVVGAAQLLESTALNEEQREYCGAIRTCSETLLCLIDDILCYSKLDADRVELELRASDPAELVRRSVDVLAPLAEEKGLALTCDIGTTVPSRIECDPTRLQQVLLNLLSNAIKFTSQGVVAVTLTSGTEEAGQVDLCLAVEDTGIGIAPEKHERVFDLFSQADSSTTRRFGGTGLGLAICKKLAARMGGSLRLESELGRGSRFSLRAPFRIAADADTRRPESAEARDIGWQLEGLRVLVAEDNPINRKIAGRFLTKMGCTVAFATNGHEAIEHVAMSPVDVVLMDCQMPELDGLTATRTLRERGFVTLPIVALTANAMEGDRERCLEAGMDDYLTKPIRADDLKAALARCRAPAEGSTAA